MADTSTSISDLPQINVQNTVTTNSGQQMTQPFQHTLQPQPQQQATQIPPQQQQQQVSQIPQQQVSQMPQQQVLQIPQQVNPHSSYHSVINVLENANDTKLHGRDIPQFTNHITTDIESTPNYIPNTNINNNFVEDENSIFIQKDQESRKFVKNINLLDILIEKIHTVVVSVLLYFMFDLPYSSTVLRKISSKFFTIEGRLSLSGILFKSTLFGIVFTLCDQAVNYINI